MIYTTTHKLFQEFSSQYRYILFEDLIDYFALFGGLKSIELELYNPIEQVLNTIASDSIILQEFPFFIFSKPFRELLIALAKSDAKAYSLFNRLKISTTLGEELVSELLANGVLYLEESKERPLKEYRKQKIKKELREYKIEPKLYFTTPFFRFWFSFIEPYRIDGKVNSKEMLQNFRSYRYRLSSLIFEQLSVALLRLDFEPKDKLESYGSLWNYHSEFDIYAITASKKHIIGECKYKNRPVVKSELIKLQSKVNLSSLKIDYYTLFSKSGFSKELEKLEDPQLKLYRLADFKRLLEQ